MALDYQLAIATHASPLAVAAIAVPGLALREESDFPGLFTADVYDSVGYGLSLRTARNRFVAGLDDGGTPWEWAPAVFVSVGFRLSKDDPAGTGWPNMLAVVSRVLANMNEDLAFVSDNYLYLTRFDGRVVKHNRPGFWDWYDFADAIVPG